MGVVFLLLAVVLLLLAWTLPLVGIWAEPGSRVRLGWAGLFFWALSDMVPHFQRLSGS